VDIAPPPGTSNPVDEAKAILAELERFSSDLAQRERWIVLNKIDLLDEVEVAAAEKYLTQSLGWSGPLYRISALTGEGSARLTGDIMNRIEELDAAAPESSFKHV
jgi:GTP-binding protein